MRLVVFHGKPCPCCLIPMTAFGISRATKGHIWGWRRSPKWIAMCARCNTDQGSMSILEWADFLKSSGDGRASIVEDLIIRRNYSWTPPELKNAIKMKRESENRKLFRKIDEVCK